MAQQNLFRDDVLDDTFIEEELSEGISVRLTPGMYTLLRKRARSIGIGPSTLARMWILENLKESGGSSAQQIR